MMEAEVLEGRMEEGEQLELVRRGGALLVRRGETVVCTSERRAEAALAELALAPLGPREDITVLIVGLGMGFTLRSCLDQPGVTRVDVVEASEAVVDWNLRHFSALNGEALADPRTYIHRADLGSFLATVEAPSLAALPQGGWLALLLDMDFGPEQVLRAGNERFYQDEGLALLEAVLRPGGVLALSATQRAPELLQRLYRRLLNVAEVAVPVEIDGTAGLDYVYRGRRPPRADVEPLARPMN